ncbi:MAG: phage virion morphogenesis protein [Candidatus Marinimicrobia bacterium]|jgi:phage gpG-like protein|nr:phage virion morphogenesis protein [Candidatus Neomarinimicrobiota bacterium]
METSVKMDGADEVRARLSGISGRIQNLSPIMKAIGERVVEQTKERFESGGPAPDGTEWKEPKTANKKRIRTLTVSSELKDSVRYQVQGNRLSAGTNKVYAAIHQFGGPESAMDILPVRKKALNTPFGLFRKIHMPAGAIPARQFLGLSSGDSNEVLEMIDDYIAGE